MLTVNPCKTVSIRPKNGTFQIPDELDAFGKINDPVEGVQNLPVDGECKYILPSVLEKKWHLSRLSRRSSDKISSNFGPNDFLRDIQQGTIKILKSFQKFCLNGSSHHLYANGLTCSILTELPAFPVGTFATVGDCLVMVVLPIDSGLYGININVLFCRTCAFFAG